MANETNSDRLPVVYIPHGGGPWPFVEMGFDRGEVAAMTAYLRSLHAMTKAPPEAVLAVSAHWEERVPTVMTAAHPPMLYDYYGFPPASYQITWPAPGHPQVAHRVVELLVSAGFETATDDKRGFDHGTFVPLKLMYPEADVPTLQLSLLSSLDPVEHLRLGEALTPLRDEGVLIVGSGMSYHNLRAFRAASLDHAPARAGGVPSPRAQARRVSETFDAWLREAATLEKAERNRRLASWSQAPAARAAHPREEHLLPLMVAAGAAGDDRGTIAFGGVFMGVRVSAVQYG